MTLLFDIKYNSSSSNVLYGNETLLATYCSLLGCTHALHSVQVLTYTGR